MESSSPGGANPNPWTIPGVLRIGARLVPDNLNPVVGTQGIDTDLAMLWASFLITLDDHSQLVPDLVETVPSLSNGGISRDGLTITYHLRHGVKWQDGAPFTADDVAFTWRAVMNKKNFVPSRAGYELVSRIDEPDKSTVVVHLTKSYAPFIRTFFTLSSTSYCILPKHLLGQMADINHADFNNHPIGTGPFRVASYEKDVEIKFVANPQYFRGAPKLKEIEYRIVPNDNTLLTQIKTHEIDMYYRASEAQVPMLGAIAGTTLYETPYTRFADIGFNGGNPPLDDVRVRRALAYATDKAELIKKVTHGVDIPADSDQPPFLWAHDDHVTRYAYDPRRAAALLDEAGWPLGPDGIRHKNGKPLSLLFTGYNGAATVDAAQEVIQREWKEVGVEVEIKDYPSDLLYAPMGEHGIEQSGSFDAIFESWGNGSDPDDAVLFECDNAPPNGWNVYHFCSAQLDAAEKTALSVNDESKRKAAYATVQEVLTDQVPVIFLWFEQYVTVANSDLQNYKPGHVGSQWWNPWEWSI
ncbi:MAG TPA: peptide ABC transporter substrate-binding protein [Candidatus Eremiobacteraceae bacterium]